ncbi:MAG: pectinesterase family protein [Streptosporangiaceae bacterium]
MRVRVLICAPLLAVSVLAIGGTAHASTGVTITVGASGADYTTVQAAVDAVPAGSSTPYTILIDPGTYDEDVTIPATDENLTLEGASHNPAAVVITGDNYNGETDPATGATYGTEGSATVHVQASNFTAEYITFSNTFDKLDYPTVTGTQAVAIAMEGDRQVYEHDIFYGHQDTLLSWDSTSTTQLRQYVYDSTVEGDVDFIFGNGDLVLDRDHIVALNDGIYQKAYLTASATYGTAEYGIMLANSTVTSTLAPNDIYLGRAWLPYTGAVPQLTYSETNLPAQLNTTDPYLGISGATWTAGRYGEYDDTGAGADPTNPNRPQLTAAEAGTPASHLAGSDGWDPVAPPTSNTVATQALRLSNGLGDTRQITQPRIPATCQTVTSDLPNPKNRTFAITTEADPPDTTRLQAALTACENTGEAVLLEPSAGDTAFLSAPLTIGEGEYLVLGPGVTLYASRVAAEYQVSGDPTCGTIGSSSSGCNPFITVDGSDSGIEAYRGGTIDGRGDLPILGTTTSWWQNAATATAEGLEQVNPRLIEAQDANDFVLYDVTLKDAAKQHFYFKTGGGLLVWGLHVETSDQSLNTDGIDIDSSAFATVTHSTLTDGDDCVAMEANDDMDVHITVADNQCYGTHGISIGSPTAYGVSSILVRDDLIDGRDAAGQESTIPAGIRVKSYAGAGGLVDDVEYTGITMRSLEYPILINPFYDPATGTTIPDFAGITISNATETDSIPGAVSILEGYSPAYPLGLTLRNVHFDVTATQSQDANITEINSNLRISGPGVTVH